MTFSIICAVSLNGIIGDSVTNSIPWHIPSDLKNFKAVTMGKTLVMGAKTFTSLGRKLPNRKHVVITRGQTKFTYEPDVTYSSFAEVMRNEDDFFVIGGEHIFGEAFKYKPQNLYLTLVNIEGVGDVRFPIEGSRLKYRNIVAPDGSIYIEERRSDIMLENGIEYQFVVYE